MRPSRSAEGRSRRPPRLEDDERSEEDEKRGVRYLFNLLHAYIHNIVISGHVPKHIWPYNSKGKRRVFSKRGIEARKNTKQNVDVTTYWISRSTRMQLAVLYCPGVLHVIRPSAPHAGATALAPEADDGACLGQCWTRLPVPPQVGRCGPM